MIKWQYLSTYWENNVLDLTMNLKTYSSAFRVLRIGSHCSPRLEVSKYVFRTLINFLKFKNILKNNFYYYFLIAFFGNSKYMFVLGQAHTRKQTECISGFMLHKFCQYKQMRNKFLAAQAREKSEIPEEQHDFTQFWKHLYRGL